MIKIDTTELKSLNEKLASRINKEMFDEVLKQSSRTVMKNVFEETPIGVDGSNWFKSIYPNYTVEAREHNAETLRRGWVTDGDNPELGGSVSTADMEAKVNRTEITVRGKKRKQTFTNAAPYSKAVNNGHRVVLPGGHATGGFVRGKYFVKNGIIKSEEQINANATKMVKEIVEGVFKT